MEIEVRIRLVELLAEKSKQDGQLYNIADVEEKTGIDRRRLYKWRDRKVAAIKLDEIRLLVEVKGYFCSIISFLTKGVWG